MFSKIFVLTISITIGLLSLIGCSGGGGGKTSSEINEKEKHYGIAQLGYLSEAKVEIYEIKNDGTLSLKWTETTTSGSSLEEIGRFYSHADELNPGSFYLYKISGGYDWDSNDDGSIDPSPTENKGIIRLVVKGYDIKNHNNFRVTLASEIVYEKIAKFLKYSYSPTSFYSILLEAVKSTISDINGDGTVNMLDLLAFNPSLHKNSLVSVYKNNFGSIVERVHNGEAVFQRTLNRDLAEYYDSGSYISVGILDDKKILYIGTDSGMKVLNISNLNNITQLKSLNLPNRLEKIIITKDEQFLYGLVRNTGVYIFNLNNPSDPNFIKDMSVTAEDIILKSDINTLFIANGADSVFVYNVTDPQNLSLIKTINIGCRSYKIAVTGDGKYIFSACVGSGINIIDVLANQVIGTIQTQNRVINLIIDSTNQFLISYESNILFKIYSISDPSNASMEVFLKTPGWVKKIIYNNEKKEIFLLTNTDEGSLIQVIDITDTKNPQIKGSTSFKSKPFDMIIDKKYHTAFVTFGNGGLGVFDISDVISPYIIGQLNFDGTAFDILLSRRNNNVIYVAGGLAGFLIIDVSNPLEPKLISGIKPSGFSKSISLSPDETLAYLGQDSEGVHLIDISDINNPKELTPPSIIRNADKVVLSYDGSAGYIVSSGIFKVFNTSTFSILGQVNLSGSGNDIELTSDGKYALTAYGTEGLYIIDIKNPSNLQIIGSYKDVVYSYGLDVSIDNNKVFLTDVNKIKILDISQKSNPNLIKEIPTEYTPYDILLLGDLFALVSESSAGIRILNISDINNIKTTSLFKTDSARKAVITQNGEFIYVADGNSGLKIIDPQLFK
ncbi:hypothetical protein [Persephonella sp.]